MLSRLAAAGPPPLHLLHSPLELLARQGAVTHSVPPWEEAVSLQGAD